MKGCLLRAAFYLLFCLLTIPTVVARTIEPGKLADLVLLDKNPLEDIKNTQTIWRVIKGGWLFDPEKLRPPVSTSPDE